jgi:hypothetical protein
MARRINVSTPTKNGAAGIQLAAPLHDDVENRQRPYIFTVSATSLKSSIWSKFMYW